MEGVLADLFAAVLGAAAVGAQDSFFDLGGSSLQVMRLVDRVHAETGVDVAVATVFLYPTPRQLAARIDAIRSGAAPAAAAPGPLAPLSDGVGELPLFLIHAIGGTVFGYAPLARELAGTFRVYGVAAPGLTTPGATASSLAALADDYTERIRAAQPDGPYRLAGWSMGGVVAFEVARRLEQAGHLVTLLALLDAPFAVPDAPPGSGPGGVAGANRARPGGADGAGLGGADGARPGGADGARLAGQFLADATASLGWDSADRPDPATHGADEQLGWLAARLDVGTAVGPGGTAAGSGSTAAQLRRRFEVFGAHHRMLAGYQPASPAVRAPALIVSADRSLNAPARDRWPAVLAGPVTTLAVRSDHYAFLQPPLAAEVGAAILKVQAGNE
jgi:thioesterase domain-containing protein/acyl carrier protein